MGFIVPRAQKAVTNQSQVKARAFRVLLVATNQSQVRAHVFRVQLVATAQTQALSIHALLAPSALEALRLAPHAQKAAINQSQVRARASCAPRVATVQRRAASISHRYTLLVPSALEAPMLAPRVQEVATNQSQVEVE